MPIQSDIVVDPRSFYSSATSEEVQKMNKVLEGYTVDSVNWYDVGAPMYRELHEAGETWLPKPVYLPEAQEDTIPSREPGRRIPIRLYKPDNGAPPKAVLMFLHGGGWVLGSHKHHDSHLRRYANACQVLCISVGYRLAPEHPYPAAPDDCLDAATYLADHAVPQYGAPLRFVAGESAGSTLAVLAAFHLLRERPAHRLAGLVLTYGCYDLSLSLPSMRSTSTRPLGLTRDSLEHLRDAYLPNQKTCEQKRDPRISPLYADMQTLAQKSATGKLPAALFLCGTEDFLLDDTLFMGVKWQAASAGSEAVAKIYPGCAHGFDALHGTREADEANRFTLEFVNEKLGDALRE
ncbi:Uu.00g110290.m01.CDS01 [Anthostomella pinea]|uniref:Uu.00g110290.m01.CDS01 n=1 Tax=Anthostomella pinea TaxID=933095 RepID=A0AAI8VFD2_9PEZI|nr:Uu.00g110290.m01.CDS01 [Anthostomella pinea]